MIYTKVFIFIHLMSPFLSLLGEFWGSAVGWFGTRSRGSGDDGYQFSFSRRTAWASWRGNVRFARIAAVSSRAVGGDGRRPFGGWRPGSAVYLIDGASMKECL